MTHSIEFFAPWSFHYEDDADENVAVIRNARGAKLAESRMYWTHQGNDLLPVTVPAYRLMTLAPKLLDACQRVARELALNFYSPDPQAHQSRNELQTLLQAVIAEATELDEEAM